MRPYLQACFSSKTERCGQSSTRTRVTNQKFFSFRFFFFNRALRAIKYKDKSHEPDDLMTWIDAKLKSVKAQEANLDSEFAALMH
jgi:hypothetical protein